MSWQIKAAVAVATGLALGSPAAFAQETPWGFEVTPYLWGGGIDGDVTLRGHKVEVDRGFDDLVDRLDFSGSLLSIGYRDHFVVYTQLDYISTDTDELDADEQPASGQVRLESDFFAGTLGLGYIFGDANSRRHFDLLLGAKYLSVENDLTLGNIGQFKRDKDYLDPVLIGRPSFRLTERWLFNPTFQIGGGVDADLIWELQPQFQFQINDNVGLRIGYRNMYYDLESENGANKFDGSYRGFVIGLGGTFGNRPYYLSKSEPEPAPAPAMAATTPPPPAPMVAPEPPGDGDGDGVADHIDKCKSTASGVVVDALGCGFNTTLAVQFETNSATLTPESNAELDRIVEVMRASPTIAGYVEGYTDSTGTAAYNKQLSAKRAKAVADYLIAQGISRDRVIPRGHGQADPVASNGTEEGRAQNRRVLLRRVDADEDSDQVRYTSDQE
ncbi:MAG TPA: OmpA family protein [Steroidobacter sp.]|uniref:OmpA family protein n=1 Tax=Steroidobacter sp. TaxID=1978227 RepID=UPI002EDB687F